MLCYREGIRGEERADKTAKSVVPFSITLVTFTPALVDLVP